MHPHRDVFVCGATQQELMKAGMMDEVVIKMYRDNVEHLIPGSEVAFIQSTNGLLWNLVEAATDSLAKGG